MPYLPRSRPGIEKEGWQEEEVSHYKFILPLEAMMTMTIMVLSMNIDNDQ